MIASAFVQQINEQLDTHYDEMVKLRRHFHQHPELSFQEKKTAAFIASYYEALGIPIRTNVGGGGVLAYIEGGSPGPVIALRADFDALPIHDEKKYLTDRRCRESCMPADTTGTRPPCSSSRKL